MIKKLLFSFLIIILTACAAHKKNIRNVELGMSKQQVAAIMGEKYISIGGVQSPEGTIEIISYEYTSYTMPTVKLTETYKFYFLNGKLTEWFKDDQYH